mgnify:FL=1
MTPKTDEAIKELQRAHKKIHGTELNYEKAIETYQKLDTVFGIILNDMMEEKQLNGKISRDSFLSKGAKKPLI